MALPGPPPLRRCAIGGAGGGVDVNSSSIAMVQGGDEIVLLRDGSSGGRHIYMEGHTLPLNWIPTNNGHSVGRWERGALVVETTGLTPGMVGFGRGWREPSTVLTETFKLSPDKQTLTITYVWDDPAIYVRPHRYAISSNDRRIRTTSSRTGATPAWCRRFSSRTSSKTAISPCRTAFPRSRAFSWGRPLLTARSPSPEAAT